MPPPSHLVQRVHSAGRPAPPNAGGGEAGGGLATPPQEPLIIDADLPVLKRPIALVISQWGAHHRSHVN